MSSFSVHFLIHRSFGTQGSMFFAYCNISKTETGKLRRYETCLDIMVIFELERAKRCINIIQVKFWTRLEFKRR